MREGVATTTAWFMLSYCSKFSHGRQNFLDRTPYVIIWINLLSDHASIPLALTSIWVGKIQIQVGNVYMWAGWVESVGYMRNWSNKTKYKHTHNVLDKAVFRSSCMQCSNGKIHSPMHLHVLTLSQSCIFFFCPESQKIIISSPWKTVQKKNSRVEDCKKKYRRHVIILQCTISCISLRVKLTNNLKRKRSAM